MQRGFFGQQLRKTVKARDSDNHAELSCNDHRSDSRRVCALRQRERRSAQRGAGDDLERAIDFASGAIVQADKAIAALPSGERFLTMEKMARLGTYGNFASPIRRNGHPARLPWQSWTRKPLVMDGSASAASYL